jgi:RNA polymerase sigma-70 factor, ECF subfamily
MIDWDELVCQEGPAVWRTAYRLLSNQADADDCFQETFLAALKVSNRQLVRNWPALLQRLATSRAIDRLRQRLRRRRREEAGDLALAEGADGDPSRPVEAAELAGDLRWAITKLSRRQAEAFCLHELGDWSYQQIADELGTSSGAVGVMLHRTRQKLRELLNVKHRLSTALKEQRPA